MPTPTAGGETDSPPKRLPRFSAARLILLTSFGAMLALLTAIAGAAWWSYSDAIIDGRRAAADLARITHGQIARILEQADLLLLDQRDVALSVDWGDPRRSRAASERLAQRAAVLPYVFGLFIVAPNGDILASSMRDVPPLSAADREYFVAQQATDQGLLISEPLYSRVSGEPIMVLSRRVSGPDGSFAGVVLVSLNLQRLARLFDRLPARNDPVLQFLDPGGKVIAYAPADYNYTVPEAAENDSRIWSTRGLSPYPLTIRAGLSKAAVVAEWRRDTEPYVVVAALAVLGLIGLTATSLRRARNEDRYGRALIGLTGALEERVRERTADLETVNRRLTQTIAELDAKSRTLRESEDKLRLAVEATELGLWDYAPDTGRLTWSDRLKAFYGLPADAEIDFDRYIAGIHPEDRDLVLEAHRRALDPNGDDRFGFEHRTVASDGTIRWLLVAGQVLFDAERRPARAIGTARDITGRKQSEEALRASHARIEEILESIDDAFFAVDNDWRFSYVNRHAERLWRRRREELLGQVIWECFPQVVGTEPYQLYIEAMRDRQPIRTETVAVTIDKPIDLAIYPSASGLSVYFREITARKQAEERQRLLMAELDHRVKNVLATIQSIARQTLPRDEATAVFLGRLSALSQTHTLLAEGRWEGAALDQIVRAELAPYVGGDSGPQVTIRGETVVLRPKAAQVLTMAIHELATNAAKYGALSVPEGRLDVSWAVRQQDGRAMLVLHWAEANGPSVCEPTRRGFGRLMIERGTAYELHGDVRMEFRPEGLACTMTIPLADAAATAH